MLEMTEDRIELADVRDRFIAQIVRGRTFVDVGGLQEIVKERVSLAHEHGAAEVALMDIDRSSDKWDEMREHLAARGISTCRFICGDVQDMHNERFDVVYSSGVLYHTASPLHYLEALRRMSRDYVIVASTVLPERIPEPADILHPPGSVLYLPAVPAPRRPVVTDFFAQHGRPDIFADAGNPLRDVSGVYWLPTTDALVAMCRDIGFEVLDHRAIETDALLGYALLLRVPQAVQAPQVADSAYESAPPAVNTPQAGTRALPAHDPTVSQRMKADWDARAREDAPWFITTLERFQSDADFDDSGRNEVTRLVIGEPLLVADSDPKRQRLLEIGSGSGRMTRHLAKIFGEVHATDVSGEMTRLARERLAGIGNVFIHETNGVNFDSFPANYFHAAFCAYVYQHVPDVAVIEANILDACRLLKRGGVFKFQTNAVVPRRSGDTAYDTWAGAPFGEEQIRAIAARAGMRLLAVWDAGTPHCWAVMRKPISNEQAPPASARIVLHAAAGEPGRRSIRPRGLTPCLTVVAQGIDFEAADINTLRALIGGGMFKPRYAGPPRDKYAAHLLAYPPTDGASLDDLLEIDIAIDQPIAEGSHGLLLLLGDTPIAGPVELQILPPEPITPVIHLVGNAVDGGSDIFADGGKSLVRVLVRDLDLDAFSPDSIRVRFGDASVAPARVEFIPSHALHMITAKLPEEVGTGTVDVAVVAGERQSAPFRITIRPGQVGTIAHWLRRVREVMTESDEINDRWMAPHVRRYAFSMAELARLDGERNVVFEIGLTKLFPFLLTCDLGYRRVFGTDFKPAGGIDNHEHRQKSVIFGRRARTKAFNIDLEHDAIPLADASVDLVLCCEVIEHMDIDPMFMLAEINRITKPGGHLFITTPNITSGRAAWKILNGYAPHFFMQYFRDRSPHRHNYEHDIHSLQTLTRAAGFDTRVIKTIDVFEETEPRALIALDRLGMTTEFRGDDIFFIGQKIGPVADRWPAPLYV